MLKKQERETRLHLSLNKDMSRIELEAAIDSAAQYMQNLKAGLSINPLIAEVVLESLQYAKETFCASGVFTGTFTRVMVNDNRYRVVNEIFNLGSDSTKSINDEKQFFIAVQGKLLSITDKKSDLRSNCLWRTLNNENRFIRDLEENDPAHRDAVNGIVSASFIMGIFSAFVLLSPILFIISMTIASAKFITVSGTNDHQAPSLLGQVVYQEQYLRLAGKRIHDALPIDLASRLLNLFKKGSKIGLAVAESTVNRLERIIDHQQAARQFLERNEHDGTTRVTSIEEISEEDTSYAARAATQQMSRR